MFIVQYELDILHLPTAHRPAIRQVGPICMKCFLNLRKVKIEAPFIAHAHINTYTHLSSLQRGKESTIKFQQKNRSKEVERMKRTKITVPFSLIATLVPLWTDSTHQESHHNYLYIH